MTKSQRTIPMSCSLNSMLMDSSYENSNSLWTFLFLIEKDTFRGSLLPTAGQSRGRTAEKDVNIYNNNVHPSSNHLFSMELWKIIIINNTFTGSSYGQFSWVTLALIASFLSFNVIEIGVKFLNAHSSSSAEKACQSTV